ncbi:unnamed protein product, partial [Ectocarpus sp. 12 AP-2014]
VRIPSSSSAFCSGLAVSDSFLGCCPLGSMTVKLLRHPWLAALSWSLLPLCLKETEQHCGARRFGPGTEPVDSLRKQRDKRQAREAGREATDESEKEHAGKR